MRGIPSAILFKASPLFSGDGKISLTSGSQQIPYIFRRPPQRQKNNKDNIPVIFAHYRPDLWGETFTDISSGEDDISLSENDADR